MEFDSIVTFDMPREDINSNEYRIWVDRNVLPNWLARKEGNIDYTLRRTGDWNMEGGIATCNIGGRYIDHCKFYKFDGTITAHVNQGVMIRDHYSLKDVEKVHFIADSFEAFLKEEGISFTRVNVELTR